jgi:hypothetical protein
MGVKINITKKKNDEELNKASSLQGPKVLLIVSKVCFKN